MPAISRTVQIINKRGLHARASAKFVTLASTQSVEIQVGSLYPPLDCSDTAGSSVRREQSEAGMVGWVNCLRDDLGMIFQVRDETGPHHLLEVGSKR